MTEKRGETRSKIEDDLGRFFALEHAEALGDQPEGQPVRVEAGQIQFAPLQAAAEEFVGLDLAGFDRAERAFVTYIPRMIIPIHTRLLYAFSTWFAT